MCVRDVLARVPCGLCGRSRLVMISLWRRPPGGMASKDAGRIVVKRLGESFVNRSAQSAGLMYF